MRLDLLEVEEALGLAMDKLLRHGAILYPVAGVNEVHDLLGDMDDVYEKVQNRRIAREAELPNKEGE